MEKKPLAFSFSKTKPKSSISQVSSSAFAEAKTMASEEKVELITSIEGKKLNPADGSTAATKQTVVIPVEPNRLIIKKKDSDNVEDKLAGAKLTASDDLEAIRALMKDSANRKEGGEKNQAPVDIKTGEKTNILGKNLDEVEEANYEAVEIEQFGKACLLGMGWSEKEGVGLTNKRKISVVEPELRPKGLGLGAGSHKKRNEEANNGTESTNLRYIKGAYVEVIAGKNKNDVGQIVGFDDANSRLFIKTPSSEKFLSVLQNCTQLLTKSEYEGIVRKRRL